MKRLLLATFVCGTFAPVWAALPPLSPQERNDSAEIVLTGEVLVSRVMIHRKPSSSIYLVRLGVKIDSIEKGAGELGEQNNIEIRCWAMRKTEMPGPGGHLNIPAEGAKFRAWLTKNVEGQWEPLEPNGFELLNDSSAMTFAAAESREIGKGVVIGGIAGLLALGVIVWFRISK